MHVNERLRLHKTCLMEATLRAATLGGSCYDKPKLFLLLFFFSFILFYCIFFSFLLFSFLFFSFLFFSFLFFSFLFFSFLSDGSYRIVIAANSQKPAALAPLRHRPNIQAGHIPAHLLLLSLHQLPHGVLLEVDALPP